MTSRVLQLKLDTLTSKKKALEAENRQLRESQTGLEPNTSEEAEAAATWLAEVGEQLTAERERSLQLLKEKDELQALHDQLLQDPCTEADTETSEEQEEIVGHLHMR